MKRLLIIFAMIISIVSISTCTYNEEGAEEAERELILEEQIEAELEAKGIDIENKAEYIEKELLKRMGSN